MRLSTVMIAKNERDNVHPCFESFWDYVDEVVLCDTGSRDGTVAEARRFARDRGEPGKLVLGRFRWCDDFAAARNHAHSLATGDVHVTMDLDDRLVDGENLRKLAERLMSRPELGAIVALWSGPMTPGQWRERLLRAPVRWRGPTWEEPLHDGPANVTNLVRWEHTRDCSRGRRDIDIALRWAEADPSNPWPLLAAADEARSLPDWGIVEDCCRRGLSLSGLDADSQGAFFLLWAQALHARGERTRAVPMAREAIRALPHVVTRETMEGAPAGDLDLNGTKADAWLLLARCAAEEEDHAEALRCATHSVRYVLTEYRMEEARWVAAHAVTMLVAQGRAPVEAISTVLGAR